jgi:hypothetical protein
MKHGVAVVARGGQEVSQSQGSMRMIPVEFESATVTKFGLRVMITRETSVGPVAPTVAVWGLLQRGHDELRRLFEPALTEEPRAFPISLFVESGPCAVVPPQLSRDRQQRRGGRPRRKQSGQQRMLP